ncbi:MAG: hypothetical protein ACOCXZ_03665 [Chloroflexota bacterium]
MTMSPDVNAQFTGVIARLTGMLCWSVQVSGVGSLANLHFGDKVRRDQVMAHPDFKVEVDERVYQGQIVLYLEECPWRLDGPDAVICSWMDDSSANGQLTAGLNHLRDRRVTAAHVQQPAFDLEIHFEGGYVLRVFPDQADPEEGDNYAVNENDTESSRTFVLAAHSTLYIE